MLFLKWNIQGNYCEIEMSSVFNTSPNFIHRFELVKLSCNQKKNKSGLHSQTYSWTKVTPLSRIWTYDTYIQSYVLSKLENKNNNFNIILFILFKLPCATCGGFPRSHHIFQFFLNFFLNLFLRVGGLITQEVPCYATRNSIITLNLQFKNCLSTTAWWQSVPCLVWGGLRGGTINNNKCMVACLASAFTVGPKRASWEGHLLRARDVQMRN